LWGRFFGEDYFVGRRRKGRSQKCMGVLLRVLLLVGSGGEEKETQESEKVQVEADVKRSE
jgi:hypothetical protein